MSQNDQQKKRNTARSRANKEGSIFFDETKKCWFAQISLGYDKKSGRRQRRKRRASTEGEALLKLHDLQEKYTHPACLDADKMTVSEWLDQWYATYALVKIRENTQESYSRMLDICKEHVGGLRLSQLSGIDLQNVINRHISPHYRTAQYFRTIIKTAMKRAVKSHLLKDNPADDLELPPKPPKKKFARPTPEARQSLLDAKTPFYCWRWILLVEFMTGMRRAELLALHWSAVNLDEGWLEITNDLILGKKQPGMKTKPLILAATKTPESERRLRLPQELCRELGAYKTMQAALRLAAPAWLHPELVFTRENGDYINPGSFSSQYCKTRQALGIRTTFHMLRHDMASRMKRSRKFDFKDIQAQLGHSTIQITMDTYTHIDDDDKNEISCWLDDEMDAVLGRPAAHRPCGQAAPAKSP